MIEDINNLNHPEYLKLLRALLGNIQWTTNGNPVLEFIANGHEKFKGISEHFENIGPEKDHLDDLHKILNAIINCSPTTRATIQDCNEAIKDVTELPKFLDNYRKPNSSNLLDSLCNFIKELIPVLEFVKEKLSRYHAVLAAYKKVQ